MLYPYKKHITHTPETRLIQKWQSNSEMNPMLPFLNSVIVHRANRLSEACGAAAGCVSSVHSEYTDTGESLRSKETLSKLSHVCLLQHLGHTWDGTAGCTVHKLWKVSVWLLGMLHKIGPYCNHGSATVCLWLFIETREGMETQSPLFALTGHRYTDRCQQKRETFWNTEWPL